MLIGKNLDEDYLQQLVEKTEKLINKTIGYQVKDNKKNIFDGQSPLLIWKKHE